MRHAINRLAQEAVTGHVAAHQLRAALEERVSRLQNSAGPDVSMVRWHLASEGKPDPFPPGDHLFILRGSLGVCAASFASFERSDPEWFEQGVLAWAPMPDAPQTILASGKVK